MLNLRAVVFAGVALLACGVGCRTFTFGNQPSGGGPEVPSGNGNPSRGGIGADLDAYATTGRCPGGTTCRLEEYECGVIDDGCNGGQMNCGSCEAGLICDAVHHTCEVPLPQTCESAGKNCGEISDGVGGKINCGSSCPAGQTCGGAGKDSECGCQPVSCRELGKTCGLAPDGCGGQVDCDAQVGCAPGQECKQETNTCFFPNCEGYTSCAEIEALLGHDLCGNYPDGCGGQLSCGICGIGQVCDRETNTCLAYPRTDPNDRDSAPGFGGPCTAAHGCPSGFKCLVMDIDGDGAISHTVPLVVKGVTYNVVEANGLCRAEACGDRQCGGFTDACGVTQKCDAGASLCTGRSCVANVCTTCTPTTCGPRQCGSLPDGCGGFVDCHRPGEAGNPCDTGEVCQDDIKRCVTPVARTCREECDVQGRNCGSVLHWVTDGNGQNGAFVSCNCGDCKLPEECGGAGFPGVCGLKAGPRECLRQNVACGEVVDACGNNFVCEGCGVGRKCAFVPTGGRKCEECAPSDYKTCADYPSQCGATLDDGCGGFITCGCAGGAVCDDNPAGVEQGVCCAVGEEIAEPDDPFTEPAGPAGTPGGFILGAEPAVGDCCAPTNRNQCPFVFDPDGTGPAPASAAKQCGVFEDSCGVAFTCGCPGAQVCDLDNRDASRFTCCAPGDVISDPQDGNAVLNPPGSGRVGGSAVTYSLASDTTGGRCCALKPGSDQCPPNFCGTIEDSCGRNFNCGCSGGKQCDAVGGATPNQNICCDTAAKVISTADEAGVQNGFNPPPASGSAQAGECCGAEALSNTCWNTSGAAPAGSAPAYCGVRENNCGQNVSCACPPGRECDGSGAGAGNCCTSSERLGIGNDATLNGANNGGAQLSDGQIVNGDCCTRQGNALTCRSSAGTTGDRRYCSVAPSSLSSTNPTWSHDAARDRQDNCGFDEDCGACPAGQYCSNGDNAGILNSPYINLYGAAANGVSGNNIVPLGQCCQDMSDAQACGRAGSELDLQCGTVETVCGRRVNCNGCANGVACDTTGSSPGTDSYVCCNNNTPAPAGYTYVGSSCCLLPTGAGEIAAACAADPNSACRGYTTVCGQRVNCPGCQDPDGSGPQQVRCYDDPAVSGPAQCCVFNPNNDVSCANECGTTKTLSCGRTKSCACSGGAACNANQCCPTPSAGHQSVVVNGACCEFDPASAVCPPGTCQSLTDNCGRPVPCGCGSGRYCDAHAPGVGCCAAGEVLDQNGDCCAPAACPTAPSAHAIDGGTYNSPACANITTCGQTRTCACATGACNGSFCCPPGRLATASCPCPSGQIANSASTCCTPPSTDAVCKPTSSAPRCGLQAVSCGPNVDCGTGYCTEVGGTCNAGACSCPSNEQLCGVRPYCNGQVTVNPCTNQPLNCNGCPGGNQ